MSKRPLSASSLASSLSAPPSRAAPSFPSISNIDAFLDRLGGHLFHKHNVVEFTLPPVEFTPEGVQIYQAQEIQYLKTMQQKKGGYTKGEFVHPTLFNTNFQSKAKPEPDHKIQLSKATRRMAENAKKRTQPKDSRLWAKQDLPQIEEEEDKMIWPDRADAEEIKVRADSFEECSQGSEKSSSSTRRSITSRLREGLSMIL